ncbi:MAG: hypothetical protein R3E98_05010 [Gemmatimonadota bacterium]|nr:hypothetical protein [Gemmatimonadota bacterium]
MNRRVWLSRLALVAALGLDLTFRTGPLGELVPPPDPFRAAFAAQDAHTEDLLRLPGVVGTAIGMGALGQPVLKVYVEAAGVALLPRSFGRVPVVETVTGRFVSLVEEPSPDAPANPRGHFPRPVPIGVSSGQPDVTAGTIGARVLDGTRVFALSNNHVFANSNDAAIGDNVLQPGRADGGTDPDDAFGTLYDFEPIQHCGRGPFPCPENRIDAALALTSADRLDRSTPPGGYGTPRTEPLDAKLGMRVQKFGRTTGHTHGVIDGIRATLTVGYPRGQARFVDQIVISGGGFSAPGDSGSLVVSEGQGAQDRRPVALVFAGSQLASIANPIDVVLDRFGVTIDGN